MSAVDLAVSSPSAPMFAVPVMPLPEVAAPKRAASKWTYEEAFKRNRGLISAAEQEILRNSRVAIAGMGGVGGVHLVTLARLGIGKFTIADPDIFEVANFNRQYGATVSDLGRNKAVVMARVARDINPTLDICVMPEAIGAGNVDEFLDGADVFVDGLDFFSIDARRLVFQRAAELGVWAITAGPMGLGTAWLTFDPKGMSFDEYFDLSKRMDAIDKLVTFAVGLTPGALHLPYMDLSHANVLERTGPSASPGCQLASGVVGVETVAALLRRTTCTAAPVYKQFDAYRSRFRTGRLPRGNRGAIQMVKRLALRQRVTGESPIPPIHRFASLSLRQMISKQTLHRKREKNGVTSKPSHVANYDEVMSTNLAVAYAAGLEVIYRSRREPFGGRAIDLACGPGHFSLCMAQYLKLDSLLGVDLSIPMIETATKNAKREELARATFAPADVTDLKAYGDDTYDLATFCDAAHHIIDPEVRHDDPQANEKDLAKVTTVLQELDRITKPNGTAFVMDLVRLKSRAITCSYVQTVGAGYRKRGLRSFFQDFYYSMFAAWTTEELAHAIPRNSKRQWFHWYPRGLPTIQFIVGLPLGQKRPFVRRGVPWSNDLHILRSLGQRNNWRAMRQSLAISPLSRL
jgi:molybdopterin/thiamine biosynthesis adenylyltransferase/ubiquinone/menaquinone biosynthesis C-methylase UbiE